MLEPTFETRSTRGASSQYRARCWPFLRARRPPRASRISRCVKAFCDADPRADQRAPSLGVNRQPSAPGLHGPNSRALTAESGCGLTTWIGKGWSPLNARTSAGLRPARSDSRPSCGRLVNRHVRLGPRKTRQRISAAEGRSWGIRIMPRPPTCQPAQWRCRGWCRSRSLAMSLRNDLGCDGATVCHVL